ncbi:HNH endonuclease signature motif containing protein [Cellulomonas aerilata]|uniref:HNH endonuclease signature motif containing protein n=1 Tax=Cellulomonas aerilata TaxID=515326 RepID=UPI0011BEF951|nr:HNH endonuclease signature motif containing protein [Cellulomonas aerilata]
MADEDSPGNTLQRPRAVDVALLPAGVAGPLVDLVAAMDRVGSLAAGTDLDGRQAEAVAAVLADVTSRAAVAQARMLSVIEADGLWSLRARSLARYAARQLGTGIRTAQEQVRLARALRDDLPATRVAAAAGEVTVEHARVLAALAPTTEQRRAVLAQADNPCNEEWLVRQAQLLPVDDFRVLVRRWAAEADADADDRGYVEACDREFLEVSPTWGGYHVDGFLTVDHGQALREALESLTPVPAAGDDRTADQRRAAALGSMARLVLDNAATGTGRTVRPRIGVLVSHETMQNLVDRAQAAQDRRTLPGLAPGLSPRTVAQTPQFEDGTPVPRILLDRLACDGELNRYVFGPRSEILDVGRAERTFTRARRSAIIARDRHCRYPGCTAPPLISECHHVEHWSRDHGSTSVDDGILLCFHHHDHVHARGIEIQRRGSRWVFTDAAGREVGGHRPDDDGVA